MIWASYLEGIFDRQRDLTCRSGDCWIGVKIHGIQNKIAGAIQQRGDATY